MASPRKLSTDAMLRRNRFTIHARPTRGEPWWKRDKKLFRQRDAVTIAIREEQAKRADITG